jgi:hypothetical protein
MMLMMPSFVVNTSNSHWIVSSRIGIAVGGGGGGGGGGGFWVKIKKKLKKKKI